LQFPFYFLFSELDSIEIALYFPRTKRERKKGTIIVPKTGAKALLRLKFYLFYFGMIVSPANNSAEAFKTQ
jgi:hypothetical protein